MYLLRCLFFDPLSDYHLTTTHQSNIGVEFKKETELTPHLHTSLKLQQQQGVRGDLGLVYTMDHEVGPWKMAFFHGVT